MEKDKEMEELKQRLNAKDEKHNKPKAASTNKNADEPRSRKATDANLASDVAAATITGDKISIPFKADGTQPPRKRDEKRVDKEANKIST